MGRSCTRSRTTAETDITVSVDLDGSGIVDVDTGVGFLDHMLSALGRHGLMDLTVRCSGDLEVDAHHTVEDIGIVLGQCLAEVIGDKAGLTRFADCAIPMDEALVLCAIDLSGRGGLGWEVPLEVPFVGTFDCQLAEEFFIGLAREGRFTLHVHELCGRNAHHVLEACFKAVGRALRAACTPDPRLGGAIPSTKGSL